MTCLIFFWNCLMDESPHVLMIFHIFIWYTKKKMRCDPTTSDLSVCWVKYRRLFPKHWLIYWTSYSKIDLISISQFAFIKGRLLFDTFVTASELVAWGCKENIEEVGIKVDFEKAYSRVNWAFLFKIMEWWGFDAKWCRWMEECISNAKVEVMINGATTN